MPLLTSSKKGNKKKPASISSRWASWACRECWNESGHQMETSQRQNLPRSHGLAVKLFVIGIGRNRRRRANDRRQLLHRMASRFAHEFHTAADLVLGQQ